MQISTSAAVGGLASEATGGTFWKGFEIGAISAAAAFAANEYIQRNEKMGTESEEKIAADMSVKKSEWSLKTAEDEAVLVAGPGAPTPKANVGLGFRLFEFLEKSGFGQVAIEAAEWLTTEGKLLLDSLRKAYQGPTLRDIGNALSDWYESYKEKSYNIPPGICMRGCH